MAACSLQCQPQHHRCCPGLHCVYQRCYWSGYRNDLKEYTLRHMETERRKMAAKMYAEQMARQFNRTSYPSTGNDPYAMKKERDEFRKEGFVYMQDQRDPRVLQAAPLPFDYQGDNRNVGSYYNERTAHDMRNRNHWSGKEWLEKNVVDAPWYYPDSRPSQVDMLLRGITPPPRRYPTDVENIPLAAW